MQRICRYDAEITSEYLMKIFVMSFFLRLFWKFENMNEIFNPIILFPKSKSAENFLGRVIKRTPKI